MELENYKDLILYIKQQHEAISFEWDNYCLVNNITSFNQKKVQVIDLQKNAALSRVVEAYVRFVAENNQECNTYLDERDVRYRIKTANSVNSKIAKYINSNAEQGRVPVFKCLNDIFGARIITKEHYDYEIISAFFNKNFPKLKCVPSIKNGYNATHIYFKTDNFHFQWELQIWSVEHEAANVASHMKHKEAYAKWEENIVVFDPEG